MNLIRFDIDGCDYLRPEDRVGETHDIYTIVGVDRKAKGDSRVFKCKCNICGWTSFLNISEMERPTNCTHINRNGEYRNQKFRWENKRIGRIFHLMLQRCYNEKDKRYRWYGGKGVKVCDDWVNDPSAFEQWAVNNGYDDSLTIDRINPDKDYCPENCRWISLEDNSKYKSTTNTVTVNGETHTGKDWARILGVGVNRINNYVKLYGMDDTVEFIKRFLENPSLRDKVEPGQSIFNLYMS